MKKKGLKIFAIIDEGHLIQWCPALCESESPNAGGVKVIRKVIKRFKTFKKSGVCLLDFGIFAGKVE